MICMLDDFKTHYFLNKLKGIKFFEVEKYLHNFVNSINTKEKKINYGNI